jgi:hypothetical protein
VPSCGTILVECFHGIGRVLAEVSADIAELFDDFDWDRDHGQPIESACMTSRHARGVSAVGQDLDLESFSSINSQASLVDPPTARYKHIHQRAGILMLASGSHSK